MIMKIIIAARVTRRVTEMRGGAASAGRLSAASSPPGSMKLHSSGRLSLQKAIAAFIRLNQSRKMETCLTISVANSLTCFPTRSAPWQILRQKEKNIQIRLVAKLNKYQTRQYLNTSQHKHTI